MVLRWMCGMAMALWCAEGLAGAEQVVAVKLGAPTGKRVTSLHFAANAEFFRPGVAAGVTTMRKEFAAALRESGIRALRFPGGDAAYYYLPQSGKATMTLGHATGHWEFREDNPPSNHFVELADLASFAREHGLRLIYELPVLFHLDGDTGRATLRSKFSDRAKNYDRDRIEEGVAYGMGIVRRLRELDAPVAAWELGNEEFAHCAPEDYARVVQGCVDALGKVDATTPIVAVGMGKGWMDRLAPRLRDGGHLDRVTSFSAHYPFGAWPGPKSPDQKGDAALLALGDLRMERWLEANRTAWRDLGVRQPVSISETMAMRFKNWDPHAVIATHGHALCYAWNWMTLLEDSRVDMAVFHDLETTFFGLMRFNVGFDKAGRRFHWLDAPKLLPSLDPRFERQYVLSPTGIANQMLSELVGEDLRVVEPSPAPTLRFLAGSTRLIAVNRSPSPLQVVVPFADVEAHALTANSLDAYLPGEFGVHRLDILRDNGHARVVLPARSVTRIRGSFRSQDDAPLRRTANGRASLGSVRTRFLRENGFLRTG